MWRLKTIEITRIDFWKNAKVSYIFSVGESRIINNYEYNSVELPISEINLSIISDIKHIFADTIIAELSDCCIVFDKDKTTVRYI